MTVFSRKSFEGLQNHFFFFKTFEPHFFKGRKLKRFGKLLFVVKKTRVAFFADLHIRDNKLQSQTDFGAPSRWLPRQAINVLNNINPDYIFGLGDLTAIGSKQDWKGYKKWLSKLKAPVFDIFGNHDRNYTVFQMHNGKEYFTLLGRVADTKAVKIGNLIFILVSEEHNPEGNGKLLTSTVPLKRFEFIEGVLKKYAKNNNIFVLSHSLLRGTTALSNDWVFNDIKEWKVISERFFKLFEKHPVVAHLTGHTHMDYRHRARFKNIAGKKYWKRVGKFINGADSSDLPNVYFLNMPCVDTAHGWFGSNFAFLHTLGKTTYKAKLSLFKKIHIMLEEKGPPIFDYFYKLKVNDIIGRPAVYYFDIIPGKKEVEIITRWLKKDKDVEKYPVKLNKPVKLGNAEAKIIASDLSLRTKKNLHVERDNWFNVPAGQAGYGEFSKSFSKPVKIGGIKIKVKNLKRYSVQYKGSKNKGKTWDKIWYKNPAQLGKVNAVKLKMIFYSSSKPAQVQDITVEKN